MCTVLLVLEVISSNYAMQRCEECIFWHWFQFILLFFVQNFFFLFILLNTQKNNCQWLHNHSSINVCNYSWAGSCNAYMMCDTGKNALYVCYEYEYEYDEHCNNNKITCIWNACMKYEMHHLVLINPPRCDCICIWLEAEGKWRNERSNEKILK